MTEKYSAPTWFDRLLRRIQIWTFALFFLFLIVFGLEIVGVIDIAELLQTTQEFWERVLSFDIIK